MRLLSCHIENFGKLSDFDMDFDEGLNIVNEPNGYGKSTLAVFLRVMFYGPDGEKLRDELSNERKAYRPWNMGAFGGSVTFEALGRKYILTRFFGNKTSDDLFSLQNADTLLTSNDFSENIGEELFGIDSEGFRNSIILHQGSCESRANDSINAKMGNLLDETDDLGSFEEADEKLKKKIDGLSDTRKTGSRYKLKNEIYILENKLNDCEKLSGDIRELERQMNEKGQQAEEINLSLEKYQDKLQKIAENDSLKFRKNDYLKAQAEYDELLSKEGELEKAYKKKSGGKGAVILALLGTILLILAGVSYAYNAGYLLSDFFSGIYVSLAITEKKYVFVPAIFAGVGIMLWILYIILKLSAGHAKNNYAGMDKKSIGMLMAEIKTKLDEKDAYLTQIEQSPDFEKVISWADGSIGITTDGTTDRTTDGTTESEYSLCREKIAELKAKAAEISKELSSDGIKLYDLKRRYSENTSLKEEIRDKKVLLSNEDRENYLCENAKRLLEQAKISFAERYRMPLTENFKKYYNLLDADAQVEYSFDADTNLVAYSKGSYRKPECYSRGMRDLAGFAFRMAIADSMFKGEKPFLIMDDPFVNIDDERFKTAAQLINDISKQYQVIYFTCSAHRIPDI